jgi:hypothetical protein
MLEVPVPAVACKVMRIVTGIGRRLFAAEHRHFGGIVTKKFHSTGAPLNQGNGILGKPRSKWLVQLGWLVDRSSYVVISLIHTECITGTGAPPE